MITTQLRTSRFLFVAFLTAAFLFRFIFGLYCPPVTAADDYTQTYVIGLKCFTTHTWPYYGPDVVAPETNFHTQMPGALEGLLGAIPFYFSATPESPYLFVNLLSFLGLSLLAWYICKRLPKLSPWFVFTWIYLAPWMTHYSTQVINPSYAFLGSILFFLGFLESVKVFRIGAISSNWANAFMGFGLAWVMQLHMSWLAFIPFLFFALYTQVKESRWSSVLFAFLGAAPLLALLLPTYLTYGLSTGKDVHGFTTGLNLSNAKDVFGTLARLLSIDSFEMPRFIGEHSHERVQYLLSSPLMLVPGFVLWVAGYIQVLGQIGFWFLPKHPQASWKAVKGLVLALFLLLYACFLFSPDMAASFRVLLFFPVLMLYSFYIYDYLAARTWGKWLGWGFIICVVVFQAGYALRAMGTKDSIYSQQKEKMAQALEKNDYKLLAERRPDSLY